MKPPGCDDPSTLALVGYELAQVLRPMPPPALARVKTVEGGLLAIRFVCTADFADPERIELAHGAVAQSIRFTSMLGGPDHVQQVSVRLVPILEWDKVQ